MLRCIPVCPAFIEPRIFVPWRTLKLCVQLRLPASSNGATHTLAFPIERIRSNRERDDRTSVSKIASLRTVPGDSPVFLRGVNDE